MSWLTPFYLLIALLLVLLNGFFVLAEFALVKVRSSRIDELVRQGSRRAMVVREMVAHLDEYLSATQLGITVASLGLGWLGEPAFASLIESIIILPGWLSTAASASISIATSFLIITFLHIVVGELAPKSMAIRRSEQCALAIAYPMRCAYVLFYLPMLALNGVSNLLLRLFRLQVAHPELAHTEQELRILLFTAQTSGDFSLNRLLMLENIFDLGHQTVKDVMIPWARVQYLSRSATRDDVMRLLAEHRFSRWPVLAPETRTPTGYLLMKDMIVQSPGDTAWTGLIRPLQIVSPHDSLEVTMQGLQGDGANMAIVLDRGVAVGLITLEDILEEVVGKIEDEFPRLPRLYLKDALEAGGVVLDLAAQTPEEAIRYLAAAIPPENLPWGVDVTTVGFGTRASNVHRHRARHSNPRRSLPGSGKTFNSFGAFRRRHSVQHTFYRTGPIDLFAGYSCGASKRSSISAGTTDPCRGKRIHTGASLPRTLAARTGRDHRGGRPRGKEREALP